MRTRFQFGLACALGAAGLMTACSTVPVVATPPAGFEGQSVKLAAANRSRATGALVDESFDLGPYRVTDIRGKSLRSADSFQIGSLKIENERHGFSFKLVGGANGQTQVTAKCESRGKETSLPLFTAVTLQRESHQFTCDCQTQDQHTAKLKISSDSGWQGAAGPNPVEMELHVDDQTYTLARYDGRGQRTPADLPFEGFLLEGPSGPAAALGLSYPGTVWLHDRLPKPQHEAMSCALAAVMLHRGP